MFINEQSKRRKGNVKTRPKTDVDDQKWKDRCRISNFLTEKIFVISTNFVRNYQGSKIMVNSTN